MARTPRDPGRASALIGQALATAVACQQAAGRREICGLCAVDSGGAQHFVALTNHACEPDRFETSAAEEAVARAAARQRGWRICAFVHTHLAGGPGMSRRDARSFHHDTLSWVIIAVTETHVRQRAYSRPVDM